MKYLALHNKLINFIKNDDGFTYKFKIHISKLNYNYIYEELLNELSIYKYNIYCNNNNEYYIKKEPSDILIIDYYNGNDLLSNNNKSLNTLNNNECWANCLLKYPICTNNKSIIIYKEVGKDADIKEIYYPIKVLLLVITDNHNIVYSNIHYYEYNSVYGLTLNKMPKYNFLQQAQSFCSTGYVKDSADKLKLTILFHYFALIYKIYNTREILNDYEGTTYCSNPKYECFEAYLNDHTEMEKIYYSAKAFENCALKLSKIIIDQKIESMPNLQYIVEYGKIYHNYEDYDYDYYDYYDYDYEEDICFRNYEEYDYHDAQIYFERMVYYTMCKNFLKKSYYKNMVDITKISCIEFIKVILSSRINTLAISIEAYNINLLRFYIYCYPNIVKIYPELKFILN